MAIGINNLSWQVRKNTKGYESLYLKTGGKIFFVLYVPLLTRLQHVLSNPFLTLKEQRR